MNNRYLFRAKRMDNGEWVEGYLMDENYINVPFNDDDVGGRFDDPIEVDPSTICQCTGVTDKSGKLIWENDIVTGWFDEEHIVGYIKYGSNGIFYIERKGLYGIHLDNSQDWLEVCGSAIDNPELMEMN